MHVLINLFYFLSLLNNIPETYQMEELTPYTFCKIDTNGQDHLIVYIAIKPSTCWRLKEKYYPPSLILKPNKRSKGFRKRHLEYAFDAILNTTGSVDPQYFVYSHTYAKLPRDRDGCVYVHVDIKDPPKNDQCIFTGSRKCGIGMTNPKYKM